MALHPVTEQEIGAAYGLYLEVAAWLRAAGVRQWLRPLPEEEFRARVWMSAVIRCFPGRAPQGGDRVPAPLEIANCAPYLERELDTIRPATVIAVSTMSGPACTSTRRSAAPFRRSTRWPTTAR